MTEYELQIPWELTRAAVCIAAWFILFYRLHRPEALWRRITLLAAMPAAYTFWILMPMSVVANIVSWAAITVVLALICGNLRRSLFTAFFYIGMEMSLDLTRSALIALVFGKFFPDFSPEQYLQYNLQYIVVFGLSLFYYSVIKRYSGKLIFTSWLLIVFPPIIQFVVLTYFTYIADPLLLEKGINIYGPGFCFGIFGILLNLGILYLYIRQQIIADARHLAIQVSKAKPVWNLETGLSTDFCSRYQLNDREKEIVEIVMRGKSNKEIAIAMHLSVRTAATYLQNVYKKTNVPNRFALYSLIKGDT